MLKQIILFFHFISFSFVTYLLSDGIEITSNLPNQLQRDSTYIVDVVISKGDLFGFAKFQQNFPPGFDAKPVETSEASFTFADGKVKFIWMALPEDEEVKISYALTASQNASSEAIVDGKFSYIHENERKSYDINNQTIAVVDEVEEAAEVIPAIASVNRVVKDLGNNQYEIELSITKEGIYGFAKLEEYLPVGAEAEVINNQKSVFSQVDEKAKFVWMSVPEDDVVVINYSVKAGSDITKDLEVMEGSFAFLDNNETKTVAIMGAPVEEMAEAIAEQTQEESTTLEEADEQAVAETEPEQTPIDEPSNDEEIAASVEATKEVEEVEETSIATTTQQQPEPEAEPEPTREVETPPVTTNANKKQIAATSNTPVTSIPDPETGVTYRVQIIAGHKLVTEQFVREKYAFQESYNTENHEGWVKYITGQYEVYKGARDKRENLVAANHQFPGPFVTAYNDGERITVQEALMITNQKWFK